LPTPKFSTKTKIGINFVLEKISLVGATNVAFALVLSGWVGEWVVGAGCRWVA